jgi:hypothetical protein
MELNFSRVEARSKMRIISKKKKVQLEIYEKGSHDFIPYNNQFLRLVSLEKENLSKITDQLGSHEQFFEQVLADIVSEPLDMFLSHSEVLEKKNSNKILIFLDVSSHVNNTIAIYREVLGNLSVKMIAFSERLRSNTQKAFEERQDYILSHPSKDTPADGGYATISIETLNFLKYLDEYRDTVNSIVSKDVIPLSVTESSSYAISEASTVLGKLVGNMFSPQSLAHSV